MAQHSHSRQPARRHLCAVCHRAVDVVRHHAAGQYRPRRLHRAVGLCGTGRHPGHRARSDLEPYHRRADDVRRRLCHSARLAQPHAQRRAIAAAARHLRHFGDHPERAIARLWRLYAAAARRHHRNRKRADFWRHLDRRLSAGGVRRGGVRNRQPPAFVLPHRSRPRLPRRVRRCRYRRAHGHRQPQALRAGARHRHDFHSDRRRAVCHPHDFRSRGGTDPAHSGFRGRDHRRVGQYVGHADRRRGARRRAGGRRRAVADLANPRRPHRLSRDPDRPPERAVSAHQGLVMEAERVERATKASRAFALVAAPVLVALVALPWWGDAGWMRLIAEMAYYLALAQLWNLLAGYAGLVSVGQQAYVGLGGYALFYLTGAQNMNVYLALALAAPFAGLISIPVSFAVFRLRGAYFAVGTWVVSEVFALSASLIAVLGAGSGLSLTPAILRQISPDRAGRDAILYFMSLASAVLVCAIVYLLLRSRHGLALTAIRDSEPASASLGVNTFRTKFIIYVATAACTGLIGALIFLQKLRISPEAGFSINDWTVVVIFMVVIGGIGTIEGPVIGMLVYIILRELLADYGSIYLILMGAIAIAVMLKAPFGIWGWVVQRYDLQLFPVGRRLALAPSEAPHVGADDVKERRAW